MSQRTHLPEDGTAVPSLAPPLLGQDITRVSWPPQQRPQQLRRLGTIHRAEFDVMLGSNNLRNTPRRGNK